MSHSMTCHSFAFPHCHHHHHHHHGIHRQHYQQKVPPSPTSTNDQEAAPPAKRAMKSTSTQSSALPLFPPTSTLNVPATRTVNKSHRDGPRLAIHPHHHHHDQHVTTASNPDGSIVVRKLFSMETTVRYRGLRHSIGATVVTAPTTRPVIQAAPLFSPETASIFCRWVPEQVWRSCVGQRNDDCHQQQQQQQQYLKEKMDRMLTTTKDK